MRLRLYEKLQRKITPTISPVTIHGARILVIRCPAAIEPVVWRQRITWRVGDQCHDVDAAAWHERVTQGWGYDWSAQSTSLSADAARPEALSIARTFLRDSADSRAEDLAEAEPLDLLRRLGAVDAAGNLTRAGALAFAGRSTPALDYVRRPAPGADTQTRVLEPGLSLLEELSAVFTTARAYNAEAHVDQGLVIGRPRLLPERALREAIVNGVAHRDWTDPDPTFVEHLGATLRVTSPGRFYGGVRSDNIINHPPKSRNTALSSLLAHLRVAERQGIGVDRMFGDMVRLGHALPTIEEQDGRAVLAVLAGEVPDVAWMEWLRHITPDVRDDLRLLMSLDRLVRRWWVDAADLAPYLQVTRAEADQVVARLRTLSISDRSVTFDVEGVPPTVDATEVLGLTSPAWDALVRLADEPGRSPRRAPTRDTVALTYARHAGRISSTELGSLLGAHATNVGSVLRRLEGEGALEPSRENRRGAGFFYRYVGPDEPRG